MRNHCWLIDDPRTPSTGVVRIVQAQTLAFVMENVPADRWEEGADIGICASRRLFMSGAGPRSVKRRPQGASGLFAGIIRRSASILRAARLGSLAMLGGAATVQWLIRYEVANVVGSSVSSAACDPERHLRRVTRPSAILPA
jgi:hypothetical protein